MFSTATVILYEHASFLRYTYFAYLVYSRMHEERVFDQK